MDRITSTFCASCSERILPQWRGWPQKDPIPALPKLIDGNCPTCGSANGVTSAAIFWYNYHSPFSTGLPDYWLLKLREGRMKWGSPYFSEGVCPRCNGDTIISEMNYPNGTRDLIHNCPGCGLLEYGSRGLK